METLSILLRDSRFWAALILLVQSILFYLAPDFPKEVWGSINAFLGVVLAILASNGAVQTARAARKFRAMKDGGK